MSGFSTKICILGDFAVGKTSTAERFVNNQFSDKYLTTIGVKVDTKDVRLDDKLALKMVLWDVAGTDRFGEIEFSYLRGASGYIFVADGTRGDTVATVRELRNQSEERYGPLPCVLLLNKADLTEDWDISPEQEQALRRDFADLFVTSAKTGNNVEDAITRLGQAIAAREFSQEL